MLEGKHLNHHLKNASETTVSELRSDIEVLFKIPADKQKIIFKGGSLLDGNSKLSSLGITSGAKLMLLGSVVQASPKDIACLNDTRKETEALSSKLDDFDGKLCDPSTQLVASSSGVLQRSLTCLEEECMRQLMRLDSIHLPQLCEAERQQRKDLVVAIQELLVKTDRLQKKLTDNVKNEASDQVGNSS